MSSGKGQHEKKKNSDLLISPITESKRSLKLNTRQKLFNVEDDKICGMAS